MTIMEANQLRKTQSELVQESPKKKSYSTDHQSILEKIKELPNEIEHSEADTAQQAKGIPSLEKLPRSKSFSNYITPNASVAKSDITYIEASNERVFISESVQLFWELISDALNSNLFADVVIGVSGGETPKTIFKALASLCLAIKDQDKNADLVKVQLTKGCCNNQICVNLAWHRVRIFLIDERFIPPTHDASNQRMIREFLLSNGGVSIPEKNLVFPNTLLPLPECVEDYDKRLKRLLSGSGKPLFVTLGLGEDGHIASWFPPMTLQDYHNAHRIDKLAFHTVQERGFPIKDRITVSMRVIESAKNKIFYLNGEKKLQTWKKICSKPIKQNYQEPLLQVICSKAVKAIVHPPIIPNESNEAYFANLRSHLTVVIFGASGNLAKKKTIPALFSLFCEGYLPDHTSIVGFGRTQMEDKQFQNHIEPYLCQLSNYFQSKQEEHLILQRTTLGFLEEFKTKMKYVSGDYNNSLDFQKLNAHIQKFESESNYDKCHRLFYLALPSNIFLQAISHARTHCWSKKGWNRIVLEKPFGHDSNSSEYLSKEILAIVEEDEIYRIDHYLGKEMVLNLMAFRFANATFSPLLSWQYISCVRITFKETIGVEGRGNYFDRYGIIRDIMQNHLLQILTVVAMERPASLKDDDIRDEKVKVLKQITSPDITETVLGQYVRSTEGDIPGYREDLTIPNDSITPTFCTTILRINNERWDGVPFILKAGKALEERLSEIRIQLRSVPGNLYGENIPRNEIVIQIHPVECIYMKVVTKQPGYATELTQTELDFSLTQRFDIARLPEAYERLIIDVLNGRKENFVRSDELKEAWRIFTPLLKKIESEKKQPIFYPAGSRGPQESYDLIQKNNYVQYQGFTRT